MKQMYKLEVFLPEQTLPALREALREADAGHIGQYDSCMNWSTVLSSWRPLPGAQPYDGTVGELTVTTELKVEFCCRPECLEQTVTAIRRVHPYEEPVINILPLLLPEKERGESAHDR